MKFLIFLLPITFLFQNCFAQKPALDTDILYKWPSIGEGAISNNGKYVCYTVHDGSYGDRLTSIQSTNNTWKIELENIQNLSFTDDSGNAIFITKGDSLGVITLGTSSITYVPQVSSFRLLVAPSH